MSDRKQLTDMLNFDAHIQSPIEGLSGGIVIMWKEGMLKVDNISISQQGIHVHIKMISPSLLQQMQGIAMQSMTLSIGSTNLLGKK